jgi:hypothetical protein
MGWARSSSLGCGETTRAASSALDHKTPPAAHLFEVLFQLCELEGGNVVLAVGWQQQLGVTGNLQVWCVEGVGGGFVEGNAGGGRGGKQ